MLRLTKLFGNAPTRTLALCTLLIGLAHEVRASASAPETTPATAALTVAPLILSGKQSNRPAGTYSPGVTEILKMLEARIDTQVILAYIRNSTIAYDPDAAEL